MNIKFRKPGFIILLLANVLACNAGDLVIKNNLPDKVVAFGNSKIMITLDYNQKCAVSGLTVDGRSVISLPAGIVSSVRTSENTYSTMKLETVPMVKTGENTVSISNIKYGQNLEIVTEKWIFFITKNDIRLEIERTFPKPLVIEEASFPSFNFNSINTWNGAFLGYGGLAWFYLFNQKLCTYGVHSDCSVF